MPTFRRPKGSLNRPTPDFFTDRAATCGGFYWPSTAIAAAFDLYNNASDGSSLHVWSVFVGNDAAGLYGMTQLKGHGANLVMNGQAVISGTGTLPGALYQDTIPPQFSAQPWPKDTVLSSAFMTDNEAGSQDNWHAPGPLAVLQPGYSLRVFPFVSSAQTGGGGMMTVTFYYLAMPGATN